MKRKLLVISIFLAIILIWVGSAALLMHMFQDWSSRAAVGDMFGAVGALFSGLALVGLVMTLYLQLDQLKVQAQEINDARAEIKRERFENTFFQLLTLHTQIVESVDVKIGGAASKGRDSFLAMYNELFLMFGKVEQATAEQDSLRLIKHLYSDFYRRHQVDLGQYFDSLHRLIKFVCTSRIEDKAFYMSVVSAQLSTYERLLLFYNCLSDQGDGDLRPLVEQNGLLKDLQLSQLPKEHQHLYVPSPLATGGCEAAAQA